MWHLNGSVQTPNPIPTYSTTYIITEEELDKAEKHWDDYSQWEALIKTQIFATIPDVLLMEARNSHKIEKQCAKHETRALTVKVEMHCQIYEKNGKGEANVHTHLGTLSHLQA